MRPASPAPGIEIGTVWKSIFASAATETVIFWSAWPDAGTRSVPDDGVSVTPGGGAAFHSTSPPDARA